MKLEDARDYWRRRGVPEDAIEDLWTTAEAARYNDANAEERELIDFLHELGWHPEAIRYISQQRALRVLMVMSPEGRSALREFTRKFEEQRVPGLPDEAIMPLQMAWIDGFANAARAQGLRELGHPEGGDDAAT